jgi:hypothetical protein
MSASRATMPEKPMNKDGRLVLRQNYIQITGQVTSVEPETIAHTVKQFANADFLRGIGGSYVPLTLFRSAYAAQTYPAW